MTHVIAFCFGLLATCIYAGWRGGAPERIVAATLLGGAVATFSVAIGLRGAWAGHFHVVEHAIFLIDCIMLVLLLGVALAADRFWPLWLTAIHSFGVVGHIARALAPDILPDVYKVAHAFSAYPSLILLAIATHRHRQRLIRKGHDRSWSISWRPWRPLAHGIWPIG